MTQSNKTTDDLKDRDDEHNTPKSRHWRKSCKSDNNIF